jgi:hypothetical protein
MIKLLPHRVAPTRRQKLLAGSALLLCGISIGAFYFLKPATNQSEPSYDVVLPRQRTVEDLGGWKRISPANNDPVFAYSDMIGEVQISVSQQPIPKPFLGNIEASVKQLADSYSATIVLEAGEIKAYLGRSARGPQSVIFVKDNVLVLIKSQKPISQSDWIKYITSLTNPKKEQLPTF